MLPDPSPEYIKHVPGLIGAVGSTVFLKDFPWLQRILLIIPGAGLAFFGGGWLSNMLDMPEPLAGFFLGLFGMAFAGKIFNTLAELSLGQAIQRAVSRWLGNKES